MAKPQSYYWQCRLQQHAVDEVLFSDYGNIHQSSSKFIYLAFVDTKKDFFKCGWSMHKNYQDLIGFFEYVFMPTALYNWYDLQVDTFYLSLSSFEVTKQQIERFESPITDKALLCDFYREIKTLYSAPDLPKINSLCKRFNMNFNEKQRIMYVEVFENINALSRKITNEIVFDDLFQEELGMSVKQFKDLCQHIELNDFFKRNIVKFLNERIPIMF